MAHDDRRTDYYSRLTDCTECPARRGSRCVDESGHIIQNPHASRILASGIHTEESVERTLVPCPTCKSPVGVSCRGPYGNRMNKSHASRRKALAEAQS